MTKPKIFLSYYGNWRNWKDNSNLYPIAISRVMPSDPKFRIGIKHRLEWLAPSAKLLSLSKGGKITTEEYTVRFFKEKKELEDKWLAPTIELFHNLIKQGKTPVLLCFCKAGKFCHRNLVSQLMPEFEFIEI